MTGEATEGEITRLQREMERLNTSIREFRDAMGQRVFSIRPEDLTEVPAHVSAPSEAQIERALRKVAEEQRAENARLAAMRAADLYRAPVSDAERDAFRALPTQEQVWALNDIMARVAILMRSSLDAARMAFISSDPVPYVFCLPPLEPSGIRDAGPSASEEPVQ